MVSTHTVVFLNYCTVPLPQVSKSRSHDGGSVGRRDRKRVREGEEVREGKKLPVEVVEQLKKQRKERAAVVGQSRVSSYIVLV